MERLAAPSHFHDSTANSSQHTGSWSSTLPHHSSASRTQYNHLQYHRGASNAAPVQQVPPPQASPSNFPPPYNHHRGAHHQAPPSHVRSRSTSGRELLSSLESSNPNWRGGPSQLQLSVAAPSLHNIAYNNNSSNLSSSYNSSLDNSFGNSSSVLNTSFGGVPSSISLLNNMDVKKQVKRMPWFHGGISRDEAESLLQPRENGLFLVRESTNFPGDFTLCVCFQDKVEHYRVLSSDKKYTIDNEEYFDTLDKLIEHYEKDADGLCTHLVRPLPIPVTTDSFHDKEKQFKDNGWVMNRNDLKIGDSIGKGEFGDVMLGDFLNKKVAVKRLKDSSKAAQKLLDEASLMTSLRHSNLVELIGLVFEENSILLVTEYMSKGSLVDYLRSRGRLHVTKQDQIMFACDTAAGMEYLEHRGVFHRDLAARNVLISNDSVAKVCDFGLAANATDKMDGGKVPIKWTAPEALKKNKFSSKSDMWSFGILLWEIYSFGRVPYPKIPLADVMKHVERGYRMEAPDNCPPKIFDIMEKAWKDEPEERPTFKKVHVILRELKKDAHL